MKIAILTQNKNSYSVRRLAEACKARDHTPRIRDPLAYTVSIAQGGPVLYYKASRSHVPDAVIPRIAASVTYFGSAVVCQFEQMGAFTLNPSQAIQNSRDKLRALQILSRHDIGITPTEFVRAKEQLLPAIERLGGTPIVIKLLQGAQGAGVMLIETKKAAEAIVETLTIANQNVLIQKFVKESRGRDIRAFVVGQRVVAAMRRTAVGDEFRSNVHLGGNTEKVDLSPEYERTAIRAAQILGLRCAGVDLLESNAGPLIMEVNSSPGLEGIETATGADVAGAVIDYIERRPRFEEVDLNQRLSLADGYAVAELWVTAKSALNGQLLSDSVLSEHGIRVLHIVRESVTIAAPHGATKLLVGDQLLCYGPVVALEELLPKKAKKRKKSL